MFCKKLSITNNNSGNVYFNYQECTDLIWRYQQEIQSEETLNIWVVDGTFSYKGSSLDVVDMGIFPPSELNPTPTGTPSVTPTPSGTPLVTPTPTPTSTPAPLISPLFIITNNSTKKTITNVAISGVTVTLDLSGSYPVSTGQTATGSSHAAFDGIAPNRMVVSVTGVGTYNYNIYQNNSLVISGGIFAGGIVVGPYNFADTDIIEVRIFD